MTKNKINKFMYLLFLSKSFVRDALDNYILNHESAAKGEQYHELHYTIDYHMYAFTQLLYTIKERLILEYSNDEKEIENYFNSETNKVAAVKNLANALKHKSIYFTHQQDIEIVLDENNVVFSVDSTKHDCTIADEFDNRLKDKTLSVIFEEAYTELVRFCKERNYEF